MISQLHIYGVTPKITLEDSGGGVGAQVEFKNLTDTVVGYVGFTGGAHLHVNNKYDGEIRHYVNSDTLKMTVAKDYVKFDDMLLLDPVASPPSGAVEGCLYYDSGFNKLRLRNDTGWVNVTVS